MVQTIVGQRNGVTSLGDAVDRDRSGVVRCG
jgi:hypothetical protein